MTVAEAGDAVLAPAIGAAACMVMREIFPGGAVLAVVLAHRAPLALADIRPPALPGDASAHFFEARCFRSPRSCRSQCSSCRGHHRFTTHPTRLLLRVGDRQFSLSRRITTLP